MAQQQGNGEGQAQVGEGPAQVSAGRAQVGEGQAPVGEGQGQAQQQVGVQGKRCLCCDKDCVNYFTGVVGSGCIIKSSISSCRVIV